MRSSTYAGVKRRISYPHVFSKMNLFPNHRIGVALFINVKNTSHYRTFQQKGVFETYLHT